MKARLWIEKFPLAVMVAGALAIVIGCSFVEICSFGLADANAAVVELSVQLDEIISEDANGVPIQTRPIVENKDLPVNGKIKWNVTATFRTGTAQCGVDCPSGRYIRSLSVLINGTQVDQRAEGFIGGIDLIENWHLTSSGVHQGLVHTFRLVAELRTFDNTLIGVATHEITSRIPISVTFSPDSIGVPKGDEARIIATITKNVSEAESTSGFIRVKLVDDDIFGDDSLATAAIPIPAGMLPFSRITVTHTFTLSCIGDRIWGADGSGGESVAELQIEFPEIGTENFGQGKASCTEPPPINVTLDPRSLNILNDGEAKITATITKAVTPSESRSRVIRVQLVEDDPDIPFISSDDILATANIPIPEETLPGATITVAHAFTVMCKGNKLSDPTANAELAIQFPDIGSDNFAYAEARCVDNIPPTCILDTDDNEKLVIICSDNSGIVSIAKSEEYAAVNVKEIQLPDIYLNAPKVKVTAIKNTPGDATLILVVIDTGSNAELISCSSGAGCNALSPLGKKLSIEGEVAPVAGLFRDDGNGGTPVFEIRMAPGLFYAIEVATDSRLFNQAQHGAERNNNNFFNSSWGGSSENSRVVTPEKGPAPGPNTPCTADTTSPLCFRYPLPQVVWSNLRNDALIAGKLFYRLFVSSDQQGDNKVVTVDDDDLSAPFITIVPASTTVVNSFLRLERVYTDRLPANSTTDPFGLCRASPMKNPIFVINPVFTNISGAKLTSLKFIVPTLSENNTLINADGSPPAGGARSIVTVPDSELGSDHILSPGETFLDPAFLICLETDNPFEFFVHIIGIPLP